MHLCLPWTEVKYQVEFSSRLESCIEVDNKGVPCVRENISFCLRISDKVLAHDPLLAEHLHRKELASPLLLDQVDLPEAATAQDLQGQEMTRANLLLVNGLLITLRVVNRLIRHHHDLLRSQTCLLWVRLHYIDLSTPLLLWVLRCLNGVLYQY